MKKQRKIFPEKINKEWTLFLDRDGVINRRIENEYVLSWKQFEFLPGVLDAIKRFSDVFGKIIIVTNQQGIGKGLMTEGDLLKIHAKMISQIEKNGGSVDAVYFSPYLKESNHFTRKPKVGMGLMAKRDFPSIDFRKSVMAGDSFSDMEFGHRLGMITILISEDIRMARDLERIVNLQFPGLKMFAASLP